MDNIFECDAPRSKGRKQGLINTRLIIYFGSAGIGRSWTVCFVCRGFTFV